MAGRVRTQFAFDFLRQPTFRPMPERPETVEQITGRLGSLPANVYYDGDSTDASYDGIKLPIPAAGVLIGLNATRLVVPVIGLQKVNKTTGDQYAMDNHPKVVAMCNLPYGTVVENTDEITRYLTPGRNIGFLFRTRFYHVKDSSGAEAIFQHGDLLGAKDGRLIKLVGAQLPGGTDACLVVARVEQESSEKIWGGADPVANPSRQMLMARLMV